MRANHAEVLRAECLLKLADVIENGQVLPELEVRNWQALHSALMMKSGDCRCFRFFAGAALLYLNGSGGR